jgi:hypothetical protein
VQIEMRRVRLHVDDGIVLDIDRLRGVMVSRSSDTPPVFDDQRSYVLRLESATLAIDTASLQNLLNRHVFAYDGAPLKKLAVRSNGRKLELKGTLHKGIDLPFSTVASVSATNDGLLRFHTESLKALGVPAKGLLELFGLELDDLVDLKKRRGVDVQKNDLLIVPGQSLPPPEIRGRLTKVGVEGDRLVQRFGNASAQPARLTLPAPRARNYIYFGGGTIRFGKLMMSDADLQLIDTDPKDPFDFMIARYNEQLVAGYSKNTPQHGLKTYMPDFNDLRRR